MKANQTPSVAEWLTTRSRSTPTRRCQRKRRNLLKQPLLMDSYPLPDGSEVERQWINRSDFAASKLKDEAVEAFTKAYALESWWRATGRAERAPTG
jgi:hypothetical protein